MFEFLPPSSLPWILVDVIQVLVILIVVEIIVSWAPMFGVRISPYATWVRILRKVTTPILLPFRKAWEWILESGARQFRWNTQALRRIDFSPMLAILLLQIVENMLFKAGLRDMILIR